MRLAARILLAIGIAVPWGASCGDPRFACMTDDQCAGIGDGRCEAEGVCSALDQSCPSGRRYAEHGGSLGGACVPTADDTTGAATTTVGTTTAMVTTEPPLETGDGSSSPSTTLSFDTTSPVDDTASSTTDAVESCIYDTFDGFDLVEGLCEYSNDGVEMTLQRDGTLRLTLDPDLSEGNEEFGNVRTCGTSDWSGVEATVEVIAASTIAGVQTYLDFSTDTEYAGLIVLDGQLVHYAFVDEVWQEFASEPYGPLHRWFSIVHIPGSDTIESWVSDGNQWSPFGTSSAFGIVQDGWVEIGLGASPLPPFEVDAIFDELSVCTSRP